MEPNERVVVVPMPTGSVASVDHHDLGVRRSDQGIGERHPARAGSDDEIVSLDLATSMTPPR